MFDALVAGHQNIELPCSTPQQLAVIDSGPSSLLHGSNLVTRDLSSKVSRQRLVKQNPHSR